MPDIKSFYLGEEEMCALFNNKSATCFGNCDAGMCNISDSIQGKIENIAMNSHWSTSFAVLTDHTVETWGQWKNVTPAEVASGVWGEAVSAIGTYDAFFMLLPNGTVIGVSFILVLL